MARPSFIVARHHRWVGVQRHRHLALIPSAVCCLASLLLPLSLSTCRVGASAAPSTHGRDNLRVALEDTAEALSTYIALKSGWNPHLTRVTRVDVEDARVQHVLTYDVGLRVNGRGTRQKEFSLSEEVMPWSYLQPALPAAASAASSAPSATTAGDSAGKEGAGDGAESRDDGKGIAVWEERVEALRSRELLTNVPPLPPFRLEGPLELWIEGVSQLRLAMPHEVDAGDVKKVILADGAAVTVHGAKEVSLARPLQLPLPLALPSGDPSKDSSAAEKPSALLSLAAKLHRAASAWAARPQQSRQLLALRIVQPTALTAADSSLQLRTVSAVGQIGSGVDSDSSTKALVPRLRVKRLSASSVELTSGAQRLGWLEHGGAPGAGRRGGSSDLFSAWPFAFRNASGVRLAGVQEALVEALGETARREGSFNLLRASARATKLVRIPFGVEMQVAGGVNQTMWMLGGSDSDGGTEGEQLDREKHGGGKGKTSVAPTPLVRQQWEVVARVGHRGELQPLQLRQINSVQPTVTASPSGFVNGTALAGHGVSLPHTGLTL